MQLDASLGLTWSNSREPLVSATGGEDDILQLCAEVGASAFGPPPQPQSKVPADPRIASHRVWLIKSLTSCVESDDEKNGLDRAQPDDGLLLNRRR
jgi:hypothetical protein